MSMIELKFQKVHPNAILPTYAHDFDSGFDLYAPEDYYVFPRAVSILDTGLRYEVTFSKTSTGEVVNLLKNLFVIEMQIRPKSGLAAKYGLTIVNTPGTIDNTFRGDIKVIATLVPHIYKTEGEVIPKTNDEGLEIKKGEKFAQGILCPVLCSPTVKIIEAENLSETIRGEGGFGSSG